MELNKNKTHPRINIDEKLKKIPMKVPVSGIIKYNHSEFDHLGIAVNQYFKLLKSVVYINLFLAFLSLPTYYIFGAGEMKVSNPSFLSQFTIGNLGES